MSKNHDKEKDDKDKELLEKIFGFHLDVEEEPQSWKAWKSGKSNYKPFSLQLRECCAANDTFLEKCHICGHELLMCKPYGGQCSSGKCRESRIESTIEQGE